MNISRNTLLAISALFFGVGIPHAASANGWTIKTHVDQMTDQKTVYAIDQANSPITGLLGTYTPELLMTCGRSGNNTELAIALGGTVGGGDLTSNNRPVNIRFDKHKEFKTQIYLPPQQSNGVYGFSEQSRILRDGSKAKRMLFQFTTAYNQKKIIDFNISGMNDALNEMHCKLSP